LFVHGENEQKDRGHLIDVLGYRSRFPMIERKGKASVFSTTEI